MAKEETVKKPKIADELRKEQIAQKVQNEMDAEDFKKRVDAFNKEFLPLLKKYKLGMTAKPVYVPNPRIPFTWVIGAQPQWFDDRKAIEQERLQEPAPAEEPAESGIKVS